MDNHAYLIFELNQVCYGIPAATVQELILLPELAPIAKASPSVVGVIDLRGAILPVLNLQHCLGQKAPPLQPTDCIIVIHDAGRSLGIIVNQVRDVQTISPEQISSNVVQQIGAERLISGIARVDQEIVALLNPAEVLQSFQAPELTMTYNGNGHASTNGKGPLPPVLHEDLFAHLTPEHRALLHQRAKDLKHALTADNTTQFLPLVVMGLGDEYFGLELDIVHEFTDIHKVTPIPCCPPHIVGNMNLRGEIVTLVDIQSFLNVPGATTSKRKKAIVVRLEQLVAGIAVDDIFDVVYLHPSQVTATPVAIHAVGDDYLQGMATYRDRLMSIVNLPKILTSDALIVNQEI